MWSKRELFVMSVDFAPHMPESYHLDFVRIAEDMLRLLARRKH